MRLKATTDPDKAADNVVELFDHTFSPDVCSLEQYAAILQACWQALKHREQQVREEIGE